MADSEVNPVSSYVYKLEYKFYLVSTIAIDSLDRSVAHPNVGRLDYFDHWRTNQRIPIVPEYPSHHN
jgi:hypothetical protein